MKRQIRLEQCKRTDPRYQEIRDRHYIPNHGAVAQQIHYLIYIYNAWKLVGIISAGSAVYAVKARDDYFGITKQNRVTALNSIINNTVFRLEYNEPNLATQILSLWRKQVAKDWEEKYGVRVHGFETFVIENDTRKGALYKADNWDYIGETSGSTKTHRGLKNKGVRMRTEKKLVFVKKIKGTHLCTEYHATWNLKPYECIGQISMFE